MRFTSNPSVWRKQSIFQIRVEDTEKKKKYLEVGRCQAILAFCFCALFCELFDHCLSVKPLFLWKKKCQINIGITDEISLLDHFSPVLVKAKIISKFILLKKKKKSSQKFQHLFSFWINGLLEIHERNKKDINKKETNTKKRSRCVKTPSEFGKPDFLLLHYKDLNVHLQHPGQIRRLLNILKKTILHLKWMYSIGSLSNFRSNFTNINLKYILFTLGEKLRPP